MKELLITLREEFLSGANTNFAQYRGLCYAVHMLVTADVITGAEHNKLISYIKRYGRTQPHQFDSKGNKVNSTDQFIWKMFDKKSRVEWLDLKISRARACKVQKNVVSL
jgi:hypothetical protein